MGAIRNFLNHSRLSLTMGEGDWNRPYELLHAEIAKGNIAQVRSLLEIGIDPNNGTIALDPRNLWKRYDLGGRIPPLHQAISRNNAAIVELLLEKGADVNVLDLSGRQTYEHGNAISYAIQTRNPKIIKMILDKKPNLNVADCNGSTPLHAAVKSGNIDLVRTLFKEGATAEFVEERYEGRCLLSSALDLDGGSLEMVQELLKNGVKVRRGDLSKYDPLTMALEKGRYDIFEKLLESGVHVNTLGQDDTTLLHEAVSSGLVDAVRFLLEKGADVDAKDRWGKTPIDIAAHNNHTEIVDMLAPGATVTPEKERVKNPVIGENTQRLAASAAEAVGAAKYVPGLSGPGYK